MMISIRIFSPNLRLITQTHRPTLPRICLAKKPTESARPIASTSKLYKDDKRSVKDRIQDTGIVHEGSFSRTDDTVSFTHPDEHELPSSAPVQGRGGLHFKRTLPSFSLEGRVAAVTGGARGLGLVMSQALVISGANVAIVDLNSTSAYSIWLQALILRQRRREIDRRSSWWTVSGRKTLESIGKPATCLILMLRANPRLVFLRSPLTMQTSLTRTR